MALNEFNKKTEQEKEDAKIKEMGIKYPFQVASIKRTTKVLGVDAKLFTPSSAEKSTNPLETSGFSRFEFTLVEKENGVTKTATANVHADDIHCIDVGTNIAMQMHMMRAAGFLSNNASESENTSIAYTTKLVDKNFRGKTPAEVLLADKSQESNLNNVKNWLSQNLARYPANKSQIDAIDDAINLLHSGKLSKSNAGAASSNASLTIYDTGTRFKSKKNEKGYNLVYSIDIVYDPTKKYPFVIHIMNAYAPVEDLPNGQKNIKMSLRENQIDITLYAEDKEWVKLVGILKDTLMCFKQMNFPKMFHTAEVAGKY